MPTARAKRQYPHMCRSDHTEIGYHTNDGECPLCSAMGRAVRAEADLAEIARAQIDELLKGGRR